jgi:hypothetical protein
MRLSLTRLLPALLLVPACAGDGTVNVTAYGESFIEDGIPAAEVDDGWAIEFTHFKVSIRDVTVADSAISVKKTTDLASSSQGEGHLLGSAKVTADDYTNSSFTIARVEVEGSANKDSDTKTFSWVFDDATNYHECATTTKVPADGEATFQITVHADHLFYDSLVSEEPKVLFQALADADTDGDEEITEAELAGADIGAYDPGSEDGVDDLWAWLVAQTRTLGHVDGEGHCHATAN